MTAAAIARWPITHWSITTDAEGFPAVWHHRRLTQSIQREVPGSGAFDDATVEG